MIKSDRKWPVAAQILFFNSEQRVFCSLEDKKHQHIKKTIKSAWNRLIEAGFNIERMNVKTKNSSDGVARDIIREADSGYEVVVIGKKELSATQEFLSGRVSHKVFQGVKNASVLSVT